MILIPIVLVLAMLAFIEHRRAPSFRPEPATAGTASGARGVVAALARVEAARAVRHPAFLIGIGMFLFATWVIGRNVGALHKEDAALGLLYFPLAGMAILAVSLGVLRGRRDGAEELFGSLPASRDVRTGAHLVSGVGPFAVALVLLGAFLPYVSRSGSFSRPDVLEVLTGPVLVACACVVGVVAARLLPSTTCGVLAIFAMGAFQGLVDHFAGSVENAANWFAPWYADGDFGWALELLPRRPAQHLVYLAGLATLGVALAFVRHRRDRRVAAAFVAALAVIAAGGIAQSRPYTDADWRHVAQVLGNPGDRCADRSNVRYCVYSRYEPVADRWRPAVEGVLARVPEPARARRLEVRQRYVTASDLWFAPRAVTSRLPDAAPSAFPEVWPDDGAIHPGVTWCSSPGGSCELSLALQTAAWAVELPLAAGRGAGTAPGDLYADKEYTRYDASGEARAVVALWLAASSTPDARSHFLRRLRRGPRGPEDPAAGASVVVEGCEGISETGASYGLKDLAYAGRLLGLPDDEVARGIASRWDRLIDPRTPSTTIARIFDLAPSPAPAGFQNC